jgi:hypothetical protein
VVAAATGTDDGETGDTAVYLFGNRDLSIARLGEGILPDRAIAHTDYVLIKISQVPHKRSGQPDLTFDAVLASGGYGYYAVLADNLSKKRAKMGQRAVFDLLGIKRHGGWLTNLRRS